MIGVEHSLEEVMKSGLEMTIRPQNPVRPGSVLRQGSYLQVNLYHHQTGCITYLVDPTESESLHQLFTRIQWIYGSNRSLEVCGVSWFVDSVVDLALDGAGLTLFMDDGEFVIHSEDSNDEYREGRGVFLDTAMHDLIDALEASKDKPTYPAGGILRNV